jgi:hypothetical protein
MNLAFSLLWLSPNFFNVNQSYSLSAVTHCQQVLVTPHVVILSIMVQPGAAPEPQLRLMTPNTEGYL